MNRKPEKVVPHIVDEFTVNNGHTKIMIADNFVVKTQEEVDQILANVARIAMDAYRRDPVARDKALHPEKYGICRP
ncbi:MAG: hypothetical protein IKZ82_11480 [Clostridia bacterium]|nr:hypothetical protein [Clostridia bacterium]